MFIISAIDQNCHLLDWDIVTKRNLDIMVAKYQTKGYNAFDIEELDEEYDYLQDDLEVLGSIIELGYSLGMNIKEFMDFLDKDVHCWDNCEKIWEKLARKIHDKAKEIDD